MRFALCLLSLGTLLLCLVVERVSASDTEPTTSPAATEPTSKPRKARSVVIILDGSGSMSGNASGRAMSCAADTIGALTSGDRFNIGITRLNDTKFLFPKSLESATAMRINDAKDFVLDRYATRGSSDVARAVIGAFSVNAGEIVLITDGDIGDGPAFVTKLKQLHHEKPNVRVMVKHIVQSPARANDGEAAQQERIMRRVAEVTDGEYTQITR